jgi:predicted nucleic acid-binding Zn ribbon protein
VNLKPCKDCGKPVSANARTCPNCGAVVKKVRRNRDSCMGCVLILMIVFVESRGWIVELKR